MVKGQKKGGYMDGIKVPLEVFEKEHMEKIHFQQLLKSSSVQQK